MTHYLRTIIVTLLLGIPTFMTSTNRELALHLIAGLKDTKKQPSFWKESTHDFDLFLENVFLSFAARDPQLLSNLGIFEAMGIREHNAYLTDISPETLIKNLQETKEIVHRLKQYNVEDLSPEQQLSHAIVLWTWDLELASEKFLFHEYRIHQLDGLLVELSMLFTQVHALENVGDINNYIERLTKVPHKMHQAMQILDIQKEKGIVPPRFTLEKVINHINNILPEDKKDHIFYKHLAYHVEKINPEDKQALLAQAYDVIEQHIYPAYQKLHNYFTQLLEHTHANHGVWSLPDGNEYYAHMLKYHTTTHLSADEIHTLGLQETRSIQQAMRAILAEYGIVDANKDIGILMQQFAQNPDYYYPNTDAGRAQCLLDYQKILDRSRIELAHLFDIKPSAGVKIQKVPAHEQEGAPGAYYHSPSLDGSRPGIFFANMRNMAEVPKYHMETLTIHEAEPGHHFQIALQNEMKIPTLRKIACYNAYAEGWALYVEKLAMEQGFYSSSWSVLGHLQDELLRAVRLVVDTGIHHKRWTREQAIEYMQKELGYHYDSAVTEVERYFVLPGQACSYKIGQLKILALRKHAQEALGSKFDIREFHNTILKVGSVPMAVLEMVIHNYIASKLK